MCWLSPASWLVFFAAAPASAQADYAREKRWADEITPGIVVGDAAWIELESGRKFLAIYAPNAKAVSGVSQMQVAGPDHFSTGMEWELVLQVRQFPDSRLRR